MKGVGASSRLWQLLDRKSLIPRSGLLKFRFPFFHVYLNCNTILSYILDEITLLSQPLFSYEIMGSILSDLLPQ
jgi:hypothetical protein